MAKLTELELAQRMKAAALKAKQANNLYLEGKITLSECVVETKDHLDNPNNTLALVEALEARDKRNAELNSTLERWAVDRAQSASELEAAEKRIAELEARTVKLPEAFKMAKSFSGLTYYYADEVNGALTAAGIKWEAQ